MEVDSNDDDINLAVPRDILAWGSNLSGELSFGVAEKGCLVETPTRVKVDFAHSIKSVACGKKHTIFVLSDGSLRSCGHNNKGQLGRHANQESDNYPQPVEGLEGIEIVAVSAGEAHNLAIDKLGTLYSWGNNWDGQLGQDNGHIVINRPQVVKLSPAICIVQVAAGSFHSTILTSTRDIYTCGSNKYGQLGRTSTNSGPETRFSLVDLLFGIPASHVAAGGHHSLAVTVSGTVYGWGKNHFGQLGIGDRANRPQPTEITKVRFLGVHYITAGNHHTAFQTQTGSILLAGRGDNGQLGTGSTTHEVYPVQILTEVGIHVQQVTCGSYHTVCGTRNNELYTFGNNKYVQLGLQEGKERYKESTPVRLKSVKNAVRNIYAGGDRTFIMVNTLESTELACLEPAYDKYTAPRAILSFTDDLVSQMCLVTEPPDSEILSSIKKIFSAPACFNASFLLPEKKPGECNRRNLGIDLVEAERVLTKLCSIQAKGLRDLIMETIVSALIPALRRQLENMETMKVYVLLPLIPNFYMTFSDQKENPNMLPIVYAEAVQGLSETFANIVLSSLCKSPVPQLERLVSVYKKTVVAILENAHYLEARRDNPELRTCLTFLSSLNDINKTEKCVSYSTFKIPELISKIDIREDYFEWTRVGTNPTQPRTVNFCYYPFLLDSRCKTRILNADHLLHMKNDCLILRVSRNNIVEDTIPQLEKLNSSDLKKMLKIEFEGEDGQDEGGVLKEFFSLIVPKVLDPKYGMFKYYDDSRLMWFIEGTFEDLQSYRLIGILCGLAIYNQSIINLPFPLALYKKMVHQKVELCDLKQLLPYVGNSLQGILDYSGRDEDLKKVFGEINFELTREFIGRMVDKTLGTGGAEVALTQENKKEYVQLYVSYIFDEVPSQTFDAFKHGFELVCERTILQLFHPEELEEMVTGNDNYDWNTLEKNCAYEPEYTKDHPTIKIFWKVFHDLELQTKVDFLLFLTACSRVPVLGMETIKIRIEPRTIIDNEENEDNAFPVAHTCSSVLVLPRYQTAKKLKSQLLIAISQKEGFTVA